VSPLSNPSDELKARILAALGSVPYPGFDKDIISLDMVEEFTVALNDLRDRSSRG